MRLREGCSTLQLCVLGLATIWLSGCATGGSDEGLVGACPPVVEYGREFHAQAADELALLLEDSAIAEMLSYYAVMRGRRGHASSPAP